MTMTLTLTADWWLLPLFVTFLAFGWALWTDRDNTPGPYGAGAFLSAMLYGAALIVALVAWLIWAVLT